MKLSKFLDTIEKQCQDKLDGDITLKDLPYFILEKIPKTKHANFVKLFQTIVTDCELSFKGRMNIQRASEILSAIVFWKYSTSENSMSMLTNPKSNSLVWKNMTKLSKLDRKNLEKLLEFLE